MTHRVPPQLPRKVPTRLAFLGEAPADEEIEYGKPLVGPSGRVFNAALRVAGLDRPEFHVTNMFDEEIPNDKAIKIWKAGGPLVERNRARLVAEFEHTQPTVIVPLGAPALFALTGLTSITRNRGSVAMATELRPGTKLLPTFHPAFVIRSWKFFPVLIEDFRKAAKEADRGPEVIYPERRIYVDPDLNDLRAWSQRLLASELLSVDIETALGGITCIGFAPSPDEALVVPFTDRRRPDRSYWRSLSDEVDAWLWVKAILESDTPKLGQNFSAFDAYKLYKKYGIATRNLRHDTRLLHHALYAELPKDLGFMGASYTDLPSWKGWGRKNQKKDD